ncbi:lantibiotic dehydratase family protein [Microbacterium sp. p3-SID338]|uniref:lantibiotic dehydratase n=1 Tax=unclassified Microbacterium TaxID=2609290 RepID=UPI0015E0893F|nr:MULTISPECIES: lantibiotic dehydratase [unclassified Microbacterium]MCT1395251.1 lantibiotic dehydratase family protein [Microbacterium sp. p3-SID338]
MSNLLVVRRSVLSARSLNLMSERTVTGLAEANRTLDILVAAASAVSERLASRAQANALPPSERKTARRAARALMTLDAGTAMSVTARFASILAEYPAIASASRDYIDSLRALDDALSVEGDAVDQRLVDLCRDGDLGVTLQRFATGLYADMTAGGPDRPTSAVARAAYKYVVRAALKPSPFASLARVGVLGIASRDRVARVPAHVLHGFVEAAARTMALHSAWSYRRAEFTGNDVVLQHWRNSGGFLWPFEETIAADVLGEDWRDLSQWSAGTHDELVAVTGATESRTRRWLHQGLIRVVTPWEMEGGDPLAATIARLAASGPSASDPLEMLEAVATALSSLPSEGDSRSARLRFASSRMHEAFRAVGEDYAGAVISEDAGIPRVSPEGNFPASIQDLGFLRDYMFTSHMYLVMVEAFVRLHGRGGTAASARGFLMACARDARAQQELASAKQTDASVRSGDVRDASLPQIRSVVPPTLAVMYQREAASESIVINQITEGLGGLVSRFAHLGANGAEELRATIRRRVEDLVGSADVYEFVPAASGNSAQFLSQGVFRPLTWDGLGEASDGDDRVSFDDLAVRHDVDTNSLRFSLRGHPVVPVYMGLVPAWQVQGAQGLACLLMNPWIERTPVSELNHPLFKQDIAAQHRHMPRASIGNAVVRRETWHFLVSDLPVPGAEYDRATSVLAFDRWRRSQGMPEEVFAAPVGRSGDVVHKPMWVRFSSLRSLDVLLSMVKRQEYVRFQEVLPARTAYADGQLVTELVSFVEWDD